MSAINGTTYAVFYGATNRLWSCKNSSLKVNVDLPDVTTKEDGGWAKHIDGLRDWTIDFDGIFEETDAGVTTMTPTEILAAIIARTADAEVAFKLATGTTSTGWKANGTFKSITITGDMEQGVTFSGQIVGNAPLAAIAIA
jgi:predicted secreted protein